MGPKRRIVRDTGGVHVCDEATVRVSQAPTNAWKSAYNYTVYDRSQETNREANVRNFVNRNEATSTETHK